MRARISSISPKHQRRLAAAAVAAALIVFGLFFFDRWAFHGPKNFDGREIPPWGLVNNPRAIGHPGHPEIVEAAFHRIYGAIVAFRAIHGRLPTPDELLDISKPLAPGHQLTTADFKFRDDYLSDAYMPQSQHRTELAIGFLGARPDGSPMPAMPPPGEKDVWLVCFDYAHTNTVYMRQGRTDETPTGFYIVLYSDGSVVRVPYGKALEMPDPDGSHDLVMPGQAGIRKGAVTAKSFEKTAFGSHADFSHENQAVLP